MGDTHTRLMYVSKSSWLMSPGELEDLLAGARFRNKRYGITGCLLYEAGHFAQVLEGPTKAIDRLLENIEGDSRHRDFQVVSRSEVNERYFSNWDMGWRDLEEYSNTHHNGLRELLQQHPIGDRSVIYRALSTFLTEVASEAVSGPIVRSKWVW